MKTEFSNKLMSLMDKHNINGYEIIKKLRRKGFKYSIQSVYKWRKGTAKPPTKVIIALSQILHSDFSYMLDEVHTVRRKLTFAEAFLLKVFRSDVKFYDIITNINDRDANYLPQYKHIN